MLHMCCVQCLTQIDGLTLDFAIVYQHNMLMTIHMRILWINIYAVLCIFSPDKQGFGISRAISVAYCILCGSFGLSFYRRLQNLATSTMSKTLSADLHLYQHWENYFSHRCNSLVVQSWESRILCLSFTAKQ